MCVNVCLLKQRFDVPPWHIAVGRMGDDQLKSPLALTLHPIIVPPAGTGPHDLDHIRPPCAANIVSAGLVSALRCLPLSAFAADRDPAGCSKGLALQWIWRIARWRCGDGSGPGIAGDAFRRLYRKSGGLVTSISLWTRPCVYIIVRK